MNPRTLRACLAVMLLAAAPAATAQRPPAAGLPAAGLPDPLDPRAEVPPASHDSAFAGYRAAGEVEVGSWREVNEAVNRIGGWRAYAREASAPGPAVPGAPVQPTPGAPGQPTSAAPGHSMPGHGAHRGASQ